MFLGNLQQQQPKKKKKNEEPSNKQFFIQWMVSSSNMYQSPLIAVSELGLATLLYVTLSEEYRKTLLHLRLCLVECKIFSKCKIFSRKENIFKCLAAL